jgi:hypothetical protein
VSDETPVVTEAAPTVTESQDNVTSIEAKKPNKFELKKRQIFMDRMQRLMSKGMNSQQAQMAIAREDYERLSPADKIKRLEGQLAGLAQSFGMEINNLRHNDGVLADALDLNFKGIAKMLVKLGISLEDQAKFLAEAQKEMEAERVAQREAHEAAQAKAQEAMKKEELKDTIDKAGEPPPSPEEATVFGG